MKLLVVVALCLGLSACGASLTPPEKLIDIQDPKISVLGVSVIVSELAADRVVREEPEDAGPTMARLESLASAMALYIALSDSPWYNTTRHDARRSLYAAMREIVGARVDSVLDGLPFLNIAFALSEVDRAGKARALREDIINMKLKMESDELGEQEVITILVARFQRNMNRVAAIKGVM